MRPRQAPPGAWDGESPPGAYDAWMAKTVPPRDLDRHRHLPRAVLDAICHIRLRRMQAEDE